MLSGVYAGLIFWASEAKAGQGGSAARSSDTAKAVCINRMHFGQGFRPKRRPLDLQAGNPPRRNCEAGSPPQFVSEVCVLS